MRYYISLASFPVSVPPLLLVIETGNEARCSLGDLIYTYDTAQGNHPWMPVTQARKIGEDSYK